jgi:hypothetical protein
MVDLGNFTKLKKIDSTQESRQVHDFCREGNQASKGERNLSPRSLTDELPQNDKLVSILVPDGLPPRSSQAAHEQRSSEVLFYDPFSDKTKQHIPELPKELPKRTRGRGGSKSNPGERPNRLNLQRLEALEAVSRDLADLARKKSARLG